jgi:hypothetical protein
MAIAAEPIAAERSQRGEMERQPPTTASFRARPGYHGPDGRWRSRRSRLRHSCHPLHAPQHHQWHLAAAADGDSWATGAVRDCTLFDCIEPTGCLAGYRRYHARARRPHARTTQSAVGGGTRLRPTAHSAHNAPDVGAHSALCPRGHGEIARSLRTEKLEQVAHCPRSSALTGEVALSPLGEVPTRAARKQDRLGR